MELFETVVKDALFCPKHLYRYYLLRQWDESKPRMIVIGLNPSTADNVKDDPTIRKVKKIAFNNGFGAVVMLNLFAIISPYPEVLEDPNIDILGDNDKWLEYYKLTIQKGDVVVFAWGSFEQAKERAKKVIAMFPDALCLRINKDGSPQHPLYLSDYTIPQPYKI